MFNKKANTSTAASKTNLTELSHSELDAVAGGTFGEVASDSQALRQAGYLGDDHEVIGTLAHWKSVSAEVDSAWARAGVWCNSSSMEYNSYAIGGKSVSRNEALAHIKAHHA